MALDKTKMSAVAYGGGQTLYLYQTNDTAAQVAGANYFNDMADQLRVGDIILVAGDQDGSPVINVFAVSGNDGTTVTVTGTAGALS